MKWTRMLGGAIVLSAALLFSAGAAGAQVPGQCDFSAQGCASEQAPPGANGAVTPPAGHVTAAKPSVAGNTTTAGAPGGEVKGAAAQAPAAQPASVGGLAFTGGDVLGLTLLGLGAIGLGLLLVRHGRRRPSAALHA